MNWKPFLNIGLAIAKTMVPGVATMEDAIKGIKSGPDKQAAVVQLVQAGLLTSSALTNLALLDDPEFKEGVELQINGAVKIMRALKRHPQPTGDELPPPPGVRLPQPADPTGTPLPPG